MSDPTVSGKTGWSNGSSKTRTSSLWLTTTTVNNSTVITLTPITSASILSSDTSQYGDIIITTKMWYDKGGIQQEHLFIGKRGTLATVVNSHPIGNIVSYADAVYA